MEQQLSENTNNLIQRLLDGTSRPRFAVDFNTSLPNVGLSLQSSKVAQLLLDFLTYLDNRLDRLIRECANGNNLSDNLSKKVPELRELIFAALVVIETRDLDFCSENLLSATCSLSGPSVSL